MASPHSIGIVGGSGALGRAIGHALLRDRFVTPERLWISNRSGNASGFEDWPGTRFTTRNQEPQSEPISSFSYVFSLHSLEETPNMGKDV